MIKKFAVLALFAILVSCESMDLKSDYDKSLSAWNDFKATHNNSYEFAVTRGSWTGESWETHFLVKNGEVVERKFDYLAVASVIKPETGWDQESLEKIKEKFQNPLWESDEELFNMLTWSEEGALLGSHVGTPAASIITMDEIYAQAKSDLLVKRKNVQTYLETKNDGMISIVGYVVDGCQDDCFRGWDIKFIKPVSLIEPH